MLKVKIPNRIKAPASFLFFCSFLILGTTLPGLAEQPTNTAIAADDTCVFNQTGSSLTNPTLYIFTNAIFGYHGYPTNTVNVVNNWPQNAQGQGYGACPTNELGAEACGIITNLTGGAPQPGLDVSFTITGKQFEIHGWDQTDDYCDIYDEDDGSLTTINCGDNNEPQWYLVQYATSKTRHLRLYFECNTPETVPGIIFNGINVGQGDSISADTNLTPGMMVEGDSYCQGWNPTTGKWFYDSYATLAGFLTNGGGFHVMADGIGGSGFLANGEGTNYAARFFTDVLPYTNSFRFFVIQASLNDGGLTNPATHQLYTSSQYFSAVTNMIGLAQTYLPNKEIAVLGIPYNDAPNAQYNPTLNTTAMAAAQAMNVPYLDAMDQNQGQGIIPATDVGWDNVHLNQAGYQLIANFLNGQMQQTFSDYPGGGTNSLVQINPITSATVNVTDYGATGDAVQFSVNTVSNSTVVSVSGTNVFSSADVGKVIEVFGAGPWITYSNWGPVVTQQDIVCLVTNVSKGTNLSLSIPCGATMNAYCVIGTNNAPAFQSAINQASNIIASGQYTNVIVNIPSGKYLMMSSNVLNRNYVMISISDTHPALIISSGGITLMGDPSGNTVLLGCGAGMDHLVAPGTPLSWITPTYAPYVPMRDTLIECRGPVANNQYPLVFQNLTMDGGLTNGMQGYNYWVPIQGNGEGWDTTHHAVADWDGTVSYQMNQMKVFTNCVFQHWRGEMLICWTSCITNAFNDIANCTFYDGNATADNMYYGQHVHGCTFNGLGKVMEYYQANATLPTVFENNLWTNIMYNNSYYALTIVGATTNALPPEFTIQNNTFHDETGVNAIQFSPAADVSVVSNLFLGGNGGVIFTSAGVQPSDGSAILVMTNFVIAYNTFECNTPLSMDGYSVDGMSVYNNIGISVIASAGFKDHITLSQNMGGLLYGGQTVNQAGVQGGHYMLDETNNSWDVLNEPIDAGDYAVTNLLSYGNGISHMLRASGSVFYLDDTRPSMIPTNGGVIKMQIYAQTWSGANVTNFYTSAVSRGPAMTITDGAPAVTFYWSGTGWTNNPAAALNFAPIQFTASLTNGMAPMPVQFNCPSVDYAGNTVIGWNWNFGDSSTSTAQNPAHTYAGGTYIPTLVVTNIYGVAERGAGPAIVVNKPVLQSVLVNGQFSIAWPTNATGYTVQCTTNLTPPVVWTTVSPAPTIVNGQYVLANTASGTGMFFRLAETFSSSGNLVITSPSPTLSCTVANGKLILGWPSSFPGFKLESTTNVIQPIIWTTVQSAPMLVNNQYVITNSISGSQMFFRLASK